MTSEKVKSLGQRLDWFKILKFLEPYLALERTSSILKSFCPQFDLNRAKELKERAEFLIKLEERGEPLTIPRLPELTKIFTRAKSHGLFLPGELLVIHRLIFYPSQLSILENSPFSSVYRLGKDLKFLADRIEEVISIDGLEVKDQASYQLFILRKKMRELRQQIVQKVSALKDYYFRLGYLQEDLYTQRKDRYVLPVKLEFKRKIKGILHEVSNTSSTYFIEPVALIGPTNELEELRSREEAEVRRVLRKLAEEVFRWEEKLLQLESFLAELDLTLAKVRLGNRYQGVFPKFIDKRKLLLKNAFHPLLYLTSENPSKVVKNDLLVERGLLITGPNQGGKTVTLKTIGIIVLMAYEGFLLPAEEAEIPNIKKIFVDLGDEQDLLLGESSFSAHLHSLKEILAEADEFSLILLDEPGRNTNPEEGSLLAYAVIENLWARSATLVVTTHSQLLRDLLLKLQGFSLASMDFNLTTLQPTYRIVYGEIGASHAFDLARLVGFDQNLLERAYSLYGGKEFYDWKILLRKRWEELQAQEEELLKQKRELDALRQKLEEERRELERMYQVEKEALLKKWESTFKMFLEDLRGKNLGYKGAVERLVKLWHTTYRSEEESVKEGLRVGDEVLINFLGKRGKILRLREMEAEVSVGAMKLRVPLAELQRVPKSSPSPFMSTNQAHLNNLKVYPPEERLHLFGMDVESALVEVEKRLNSCFLFGIKRLLLVHGHGTGRLRSALWEYLKSHPLVERIESAPLEKGGTGATLVTIIER